MANRHRPRRGPAGHNILVTGDTGTTAGAQGGAKPGASESGDLDSREFGVPQADIPGGLRHVVNPETTPAATAAKQLRPADEHKFHGVPPMDFGQYADVPGTEQDKPGRPEPEPKTDDAVPVYLVERGGDERMIRRLVVAGPLTLAIGAVQRIADRDPHRRRLYVCKEASTGACRITSDRFEAEQGIGLAIPSTTLQSFDTQDEVFVTNTGAATTVISWGFDTDVPASGA
jgi:hypothetical protein